MYKTGNKIIAAILAFILAFANVPIIGTYAMEEELEKQTTETNHANISFDAYFQNEEEQTTHSASQVIGETATLYAKINVEEAGYLKDAQIQYENANFVVNAIQENEFVQKVEEGIIQLNQINKETEAMIEIPISFKEAEQIAIEELEKETIIQLTGIYVDAKGKEVEIEKEISIKLTWTSEVEVVLEEQVEKYIPYEIDGKTGVILQTVLRTNIQNNTLPVKQTDIQIVVPIIEGIAPSKVQVSSNSTKATNGDENGQDFTQENYVYDENTKQLTICVKNEPDATGTVAWNKNAVDEYLVQYEYDSKELEAVLQTDVEITLQATSTIETYGSNIGSKTAEVNQVVTLKEQIGDITSFEMTSHIDKLSKSYLYTNIGTSYEQTIIADIAIAELTDSIVITQHADGFLQEETFYSLEDGIYNKTITISKKQLEEILGQEGKVEIYTGTTYITTIDQQMEANEQGNYVIDLEQYNIATVTLKTTQPVAAGKLQFVFEKAIKTELPYSDVQVKSFTQYQMSATGEAYYGETKIIEKTVAKEITLTEPETKADLIMSQTNLSTVVTNQNVEIKAVLRTDTEDCKLYKNPTLTIVLPSYVEEVRIKDIKLLFDEELNIKNVQLNNNSDGTKSIVVEIEGTQSKYSIGAISGGANVIITADITVNKFTPNKQADIIMYYTNENVITKARTMTEEQKQTTATVSFVAPTGVVTTNAIANYAEGEEQLVAISGEEKTGVIETIAEARTVQFDMTVMNNYNNTIDNIHVLGRVPYEGNKTILTSQELGSTFRMAMQSTIQVTGIDSNNITIYYSENGEATKDITLTTNGWTTTPTDLSKIKSYLIVVDTAMQTGDTFNFSYTAQIPANLQHNESAFETYAVYFNNHLEDGTIEDKVEATKLGVTTGKGAVLEAIMTSNIEENTAVLEGKIIKYTLTVNNIGTHTAENVKASINLPNCMSYVIEDTSSTLGYQYAVGTETTIEFGNIAGGESATKQVWAKVEKLVASDICTDESHYVTANSGATYHSSEYTHEDSEYTAKVTASAEISATNLAKPIQSSEVTNTITRAYFVTSVIGKGENNAYVKDGITYIYRVNVKSSDKSKNRENTTVTIVLPAELKYEGIELQQYNADKKGYEDIASQAKVEYHEATKTLTVNIGSVNGNYAKELYVKAIVQKLPEGVYERQVELKASVEADNTKQESIDTLQVTVHKAGIKVTQTSNIPENTRITTDEDFKYIFTIENLSGIPVEDITLTDILPEGVKYVNGKITYSDGKTKTFSSKNEEGYPEIKMDLAANVTARIEINVLADLLDEDKTVQNKATITQREIGTIETNTFTHIISAFTGKTNEEKEQSPKRISGLVWIDTNGDGIRDEEEEKVSGTQVMLLNNTTGALVVDETGNAIIKTTDEKGIYTFENITQGSYTIIFLYDAGNYSATSYQIGETEKNSDAVDAKITVDGEIKIAAITEAINVTNENVYNIDLGLVINQKFDLKIDKTVTKITVQNPTGTAEYTYGDSKLAKRDLIGKYVDQTTLIVEYKIKVTNEGGVDGYVKKIADYIPNGMSFNAELNRDWYATQTGVVLNSSLANTKIEAGESKEVTLLLTMKVSEENLGIINNRAEIYEAYNDLGLEDVDSTPANQASNEDDISSADILITVRTGETVLFIGLTILVVAIIGIGAYFIKKKVLK